MSTTAKQVWQLYRAAKEGQATTIRSGYGLCGIYPYSKEQPHDFTRSESDAEHVYGCIMLAMNIMEMYPYLIKTDRRYDVLRCLAVHELGENESGDIPDDGTRNEARKDAEEYEYVKNYLLPWSLADANQVLSLFREMQKKSTKTGKFVYCVDKTEAILQNLIYEAEGRCGSFLAKSSKFQLSERDQMEMEATGSVRPADNWAYDFRRRYGENIWFFDVFFDIICEAAKDVRGEDFSWIDTP